jgi:hypothetical protein
MKVVSRWGRPGTLTREQLNPSWYAFTTLLIHPGISRHHVSLGIPHRMCEAVEMYRA